MAIATPSDDRGQTRWRTAAHDNDAGSRPGARSLAWALELENGRKRARCNGLASANCRPAQRCGNGWAAFRLHDDAEVIRQHVTDIDGPVVVVAHSYGGVPASEGTADLPNVRHIIYLAGFQLDIGESILTACGGTPPEWWNINGETVTPNRPHEVLYADLAPTDASQAIAQLTPPV
jgi:hypothetical protein